MIVRTQRDEQMDVSPLFAYNVNAQSLFGGPPLARINGNNTAGTIPPPIANAAGITAALSQFAGWYKVPDDSCSLLLSEVEEPKVEWRPYNGAVFFLQPEYEVKYEGSWFNNPLSYRRRITNVYVRFNRHTADGLVQMGLLPREAMDALPPESVGDGPSVPVTNAVVSVAKSLVMLGLIVAAIWFIPKKAG